MAVVTSTTLPVDDCMYDAVENDIRVAVAIAVDVAVAIVT
jgi:hypothetical protein